MLPEPADLRARAHAFLRDHRLPLVDTSDDARTATLLEAHSGKRLSFAWESVKALEERSSELRNQPYLLVLFHNGRQFALADVGVAFAPAVHNTGPLPELPATLCFRDLAVLSSGAEALIDQGRAQEAVRGVLACIALLDGARAVGFEVGAEEKRLERLLARLERG